MLLVRNTDYVGHVGDQQDSDIRYSNPWLVVNTSDRHSARLNLIKSFENQLKRHAATKLQGSNVITCGRFRSAFVRNDLVFDVDEERQAVPTNIVEEREHGLSVRALFQSFLLACLFYIYSQKTFGIGFEDIS